MGPVITVNSATLVNKGLEIIEAHLLFGIPYERIDVVVHPQSLVHSMVEFVDGSTIAQLSPPDMRLPIALALGWPDRVPDAAPGMDWTDGAVADLRAARHRGLPGRRAGQSRRSGGWQRAGGVQRGQRGGRRGLPGGPAARSSRSSKSSSGLSAGWLFGNSARLPMCWTVRARRADSRAR